MSWMDSWSRPGKRAAVPPPLYLTHGEEVLYCRTCGRVVSTFPSSNLPEFNVSDWIDSRKSQQKKAQPVKYCSERCRHRRPGKLDRRIESVIAALLHGEFQLSNQGPAKNRKKGDQRILVTCDEIERFFFETSQDTENTAELNTEGPLDLSKDRDSPPKPIETTKTEDWAEDEEQLQLASDKTRPLIRPRQSESDVNGSVGGEKGWSERVKETPTQLSKRVEGLRRAEQREMVRRAARRAVVFGIVVTENDEDARRDNKKKKDASDDKPASHSEQSTDNRLKCEAVMNGAVVEPSFAKGNWAVRWREEA